MWQYQNTDELYHYGILGMKWGHRKAIQRDHAKKTLGSSRYNYHKKKYGEGRVNRMTKSMDKGMSYKEALQKETTRLYRIRAAKALAIIGGVTLGSMDLMTGGELHRNLISSGKNIVDKTLTKSIILDKDGDVIKRYIRPLGKKVKPLRLKKYY